MVLASGKFQPLSNIDKSSTRDPSADNISLCSICGGNGEGSQRILKMINDDNHEITAAKDDTIYTFSRTLPMENGNGKSTSKKPYSRSRSSRQHGRKHRSQKQSRSRTSSHRDTISMENIDFQNCECAPSQQLSHTEDESDNQRYSEFKRRSSCIIYCCDSTDSDSSSSSDVSFGKMAQNKPIIYSHS